ncbi:fatty acid--CoA ligase [Psychrobacter sp.]|uniref:fatty acid--CoA ligase n=1 Tax=Psychrobacter sp. TaxID=56811 RepID=UPI0025D25234|nr:fatty acid--CoA ligase [Psychrobacter sp.]
MTQNYPSAEQAHNFPLIIKHLLDRSRMTANEEEIVFSDKARMTYKQFFKRIAKLANVLKALNLEKGDVISVMDWDTPRFLESYFAVPMSQYVLQTVNIRLSPEKILYTINHAKPKVLLLNSEFAPMVKDYQFDNSSIQHIIWLDDDGVKCEDVMPERQSLVVGEYETLLDKASDDFYFEDFDENAIAVTFYTSGTTGNPKGVFYSHRQLVLHTMAVASTLGTLPQKQGVVLGDVYMPMTPMFHAMAWGFPYMVTMLGLKQVYPGRYSPDKLIHLMETEKVTLTHCVPTIVQMILDQAQKEGKKFNGLKMLTGGTRLTEGLATNALSSGIEIFTGYGMSETGPLISVTEFKSNEADMDLKDDVKRRCLSGKPVIMVENQLWDDTGKLLANDGAEVGELVVRAPWLTQSYAKNSDAGDELWEGGYMHTQDIASIRADGWLQISDRLKDVIKTGGEWISSLEIETILSLHPAVADVAVVGIPDEKWSERPLAVMVFRSGFEDTNPKDIIALTEQAAEKGLIPKYGIPEYYKIVEALPKTSVGKHDKKVMREIYANHSAN